MISKEGLEALARYAPVLRWGEPAGWFGPPAHSAGVFETGECSSSITGRTEVDQVRESEPQAAHGGGRHVTPDRQTGLQPKERPLTLVHDTFMPRASQPGRRSRAKPSRSRPCTSRPISRQ